MTTASNRSPRRRTVVALGVVLAVLVGFVVRLVDIQVVNANDHVADSMETALGASRDLYGTRGDIVDRHGTELAGSVMLYDAQLDPANHGGLDEDGDGEEDVSWPEVAERIGKITGQKGAEIEQLVTEALERDPESHYAELKRGLTTQQYRDLGELGIPFLHFTRHPARSYPNGAVAGNLVGFTGSDGEPLAGLERSQNSCLAAKNGKETYQIGANGVVIPGTEKTDPAVDGGQLNLTIDADLQWYMQQMIAEHVNEQEALSGSVLVADVDSGAILAAAEAPTVDPNDVGASAPEDRGSRIFSTVFEPGSTFKAVTAATVIDAGGATPLSSVTASSSETFPNGAHINDPFVHPTYNYTLAGALIDSSNVAMSKYGEMVSAETRHDYLQRFGVGEKTDIRFPGESGGLLRPADQWDNQSYYTTNFGQAFAVTSPQVLGAYQAIANDGVKQPLHLIDSCVTPDGERIEPEREDPERIISEQTAKQTQRLVENVALQSTVSDLVEVPGYRVAAKTGTAQKANEDGSGYKPGAYYTSVVGFAPADDPQYAVIVTLDEPRKVTSSAAAAPAFQQAMTQTLKANHVMPTSPGPESLLPKFAE